MSEISLFDKLRLESDQLHATWSYPILLLFISAEPATSSKRATNRSFGETYFVHS